MRSLLVRLAAFIVHAVWSTVSVIAVPAAGRAQSAAPPEWRLRYIDLRVAIDPAARTVGGSSRLVLTAGAGNASPLVVDAGDSLVVDSAFMVATDGRRAAGTREVGRVRFDAPGGAKPGASYVATVWYHGALDRRFVGYNQRETTWRAASYGVPNAARSWWPSLDSPSQKADSADIRITAPRALIVASNGRQVSRTVSAEGAWATTHRSTRYPLYAEGVSFAMADFTVARQTVTLLSGVGLPVEFYVFPEDSAKATVSFAQVPRIMAFLEERLGPYPFAKEKYALAEMTRPSFREGHTITNIGASMVSGTRQHEHVISHEMAHQWFGNSITVRDWADIWLNESLAEFMSWEWVRQSQDDSAYAAVLAGARATPLDTPIVPADPANPRSLFGNGPFVRGPLVLTMLRDLMGSRAFDQAVRDYVRLNTNGLVSTADFMQASERAYGKPLKDFFDTWVYSAATRPAP